MEEAQKLFRKNIVAKLSAFFFYKQDGIDTVIREYPEQLAFVREHQGKSFHEVEQLLACCLKKAQVVTAKI